MKLYLNPVAICLVSAEQVHLCSWRWPRVDRFETSWSENNRSNLTFTLLCWLLLSFSIGITHEEEHLHCNSIQSAWNLIHSSLISEIPTVNFFPFFLRLVFVSFFRFSLASVLQQIDIFSQSLQMFSGFRKLYLELIASVTSWVFLYYSMIREVTCATIQRRVTYTIMIMIT